MQNTLRLVVCSDLRRDILVSLSDGKKSLGDLRDKLNISSTTAIHALRELEKNNLTFKDKNRNYSLTNIGRIISLKLLDFSIATEVLKKHEKFWLEHDLSGVPEHLLEKIGCLKESTLITNTETDLFKTHSNFMNLLKNAKEVKGVSPIYSPDFPPLFEELLLEKNTDVHLILTNDVKEKIDVFLKKAFIKKNSRFKLNIINENRVAAFAVTDYFLSIGFFKKDAAYDFNNDLISYSKEAIDWGRELFDHYAKISKRFI